MFFYRGYVCSRDAGSEIVASVASVQTLQEGKLQLRFTSYLSPLIYSFFEYM